MLIAATRKIWWDGSHNLQWMSVNSSGGRGEEGEAVGEPCVLGSVLTVWRLMMMMIRLSGCGRNWEKANKVGVCYTPPNQGEEADKIFYGQMG